MLEEEEMSGAKLGRGRVARQGTVCGHRSSTVAVLAFRREEEVPDPQPEMEAEGGGGELVESEEVVPE